MEDLRYPIGKFQWSRQPAPADRSGAIEDLDELPARLRTALTNLSEEQIDTPYRPDGWTVRQVVHHIADSHLNACIRFRLALTESEPLIKTYDEKAWAGLIDARTAAVECSLKLIEGLHERWVVLMRSMSTEDFARRFNHPERGVVDLDWLLQLYAWHGRHHVAHITSLRSRRGW